MPGPGGVSAHGHGSCSCLPGGKKLPREAVMRQHILKIYDIVVFGSFGIFLVALAAKIPTDARMRLLGKALELMRTGNGF
jgi:hypothetical protein